MCRFEAGDRDCLCAITHLEEDGMGEPAQDLVKDRSSRAREEDGWEGSGLKQKGVAMREGERQGTEEGAEKEFERQRGMPAG